jgi:hypothetical protein
MANKRIDELPLILSGDITSNDVLAIVDIDSGITNSITIEQIKEFTNSGLTDTFVTGGTYFTGGTLELVNNQGNTFQITGLTDDLNNEIAGLAETDEETITLNVSTNKIELKEIVGPASGGTRTFQGDVVISGGTLFSDVISATTYQNLPLDIYGTGLTFNVGNYELTLDGGNGILSTADLSILSSDLTITGGTYDPNTGEATFTNNSGGTFNVAGFLTGFTDTFVTGGTYNTGEITFTNNTGGTFNVTGLYTGETSYDYLPLSGGTVTGSTEFTDGIITNTVSATTYNNLPVSGLTEGSNISLTNNDGNYTVAVTGITNSINTYFNAGSGTTVNWDVSGQSTNYDITLTGTTTLNLSNVRNGEYGTIIVRQDGVGGRTLTLGTVNGSGSTHRVANGGGGAIVLTSNANTIDILTFTYNGSTMFWTVGNDYT